jgi:hypothetical protein
MTSYIPEILWAKADGKWIGSKGLRFATRAEAEAHIAWVKAREAQRRYDDEPSEILETRVKETHWGHTFVWDFENNLGRERIPADAWKPRTHLK